MLTQTSVLDKGAIALSLLCAIHCLFTPILLVAVPTLTVLNLDNEAFHTWMVFAVIPLSVIGLTLGCKKHSQKQVLAIGLFGLVLLLSAIMLPHEWLGERGEKILTLAGAIVIAYSHIRNSILCQKSTCCAC